MTFALFSPYRTEMPHRNHLTTVSDGQILFLKFLQASTEGICYSTSVTKSTELIYFPVTNTILSAILQY